MIGNRRFENNRLVSWSQRRCSCGRFLSKHQLEHCSVCAGIVNVVSRNERQKAYNGRHLKERKASSRKQFLERDQDRDRTRKWVWYYFGTGFSFVT